MHAPRHFETDITRDGHRLWYNFEISLRTVRAPGADRPPFILEIHQRQQCLWYKLSNSQRTVRRTDHRLNQRKHPLWNKMS